MKLRFQPRIVLFFSSLFVGIQALILAYVFQVTYENATAQLDDNLLFAEQAFERLIMDQGKRIASETHILVADFGFRTTIVDGDAKTIASALDNLSLRIGSQRALYIDLQGNTIADTQQNLQGQGFIFSEALADAEQQGSAVVFGLLDHTLYQWAIVPVLAPVPIGWVAVAIEVELGKINQFKQLTTLPLEISLIQVLHGRGSLQVSSLAEDIKVMFQQLLNQTVDIENKQAQRIELGERIFISRLHTLPSADSQQPILAALQIDLDQVLAAYMAHVLCCSGFFCDRAGIGIIRQYRHSQKNITTITALSWRH